MQNPPPSDQPCNTYQKFKFCSFGLDCQFRHEGESPSRTLEELNQELIHVGLQHTKGYYKCMLCGTESVGDGAVSKVGETYSYRYCLQCGNFLFYPHVQIMVLKLLEECDTDYTEFRRRVKSYHKRLPMVVQIPFMYEAHRWATSRYAWSLINKDTFNEIFEILFKYQPDCKRMVSVGSGTGYVEHVAYHSAKEMGRELDMQAFDVLIQNGEGRINFDVKVQVGGVESLEKLGDMSETVLLLCWPPFGSQRGEESQMAFDTIRLYESMGGKYLVYVGDVNATGDWRFHDRLASHWGILEETYEFSPLDVWVCCI